MQATLATFAAIASFWMMPSDLSDKVALVWRGCVNERSYFSLVGGGYLSVSDSTFFAISVFSNVI
jgi:hypothetical protein